MSDKHKRNFQNASKRLNTKNNISDDLENLNNDSNFLKYKRFIRQKCAAGYLSKDFSCQPYPSGNGEFCDICGKSREELEKMMKDKFGNNWKKQIKEMYCGPIKSAVSGLNDKHSERKETDFTKHFCTNTITETIKDGENKDIFNIMAFKTLPNKFRIRPTDDKKLTVIAGEDIKQYTQFGPYVGTSKKAEDYRYSWQFKDSNDNIITKNGESCFYSNWMSRIRKNSSLANCVAWVDGNEVFYKTIKPIQKDEELFVHPKLVRKNTNKTEDASNSKSPAKFTNENNINSELNEQLQILDYIDDESFKQGIQDVYQRIYHPDVDTVREDNMNKNDNYSANNWVNNFRGLLSTNVQRVFSGTLNDNNSGHLLVSGPVAAMSKTNKGLNLTDLHTIYKLGGGLVNAALVEYYTRLQIEMFGLERVCSLLPFFVSTYLKKFENFTGDNKVLEEDGQLFDLLEKMKGKKYVVGGFLSAGRDGGHWHSVVACRNDRTVYVTNPVTSGDHIANKNEIINFFNHAGWNVDSVQSLQTDTQTDSINCGIYVMEMHEQVFMQIKAHERSGRNAAFQPPAHITINYMHMETGRYRWKIAETIMHKNFNTDDGNKCSWTHGYGFEKSPNDLEKKLITKGQEVVNCGRCNKKYHRLCLTRTGERKDCACFSRLDTDNYERKSKTPQKLIFSPKQVQSSSNKNSGSEILKLLNTTEKDKKASKSLKTPEVLKQVVNKDEAPKSLEKKSGQKRKATETEHGSASKITKDDRDSRVSPKQPRTPNSKSSKNPNSLAEQKKSQKSSKSSASNVVRKLDFDEK